MRTRILLLFLLCANLVFAHAFDNPYDNNFSPNTVYRVQINEQFVQNGRITVYPIGATTPQEESTRPVTAVSRKGLGTPSDPVPDQFEPVGDAVWFLLLCCGAFVALKRRKKTER